MKKNNLISKNLYDVIKCLKDFEITEYSYKNCDAKTLTEFIRSICQWFYDSAIFKIYFNLFYFSLMTFLYIFI